MIDLIQGDCLEKLKEIPDHSVDMVLTDPPYGLTKNKWDSVINLSVLWPDINMIVKQNKVICLFSQMPFSAILVGSNIERFKYNWVWKKQQGTGHLNAKKRLLKDHEEINVFCNGTPVYYPQFGTGKSYVCKSGKGSKNYNKQRSVETKNNGKRFPKTVLNFNSDKNKLHPTQKPVKLLEYLIKTYTKENETVLDFTMGSGSTAIACLNLNRKFIGIELDEGYFNLASERINKHRLELEKCES